MHLRFTLYVINENMALNNSWERMTENFTCSQGNEMIKFPLYWLKLVFVDPEFAPF